MPIDIIIGLGLAKNALDIVKAVREAVKQKRLSNEEMLDYLSTLQDKLVDVKTALADADDEKRQLTRKIEELQAEAKRRQFLKEEYEFQDNMVWRKNTRESPYCPVCFQKDAVLLNLQDWGDHQYHCPIHDKEVFQRPSIRKIFGDG